jgi:hypothetical protein
MPNGNPWIRFYLISMGEETEGIETGAGSPHTYAPQTISKLREKH